MLTELRLPTIKRLATDLCAQSDLEGWPAHRLLEALLEHEIAEREARRIDRHRAESCLQTDKRLSSFDFAAVPSVSKAQVTALAEGIVDAGHARARIVRRHDAQQAACSTRMLPTPSSKPGHETTWRAHQSTGTQWQTAVPSSRMGGRPRVRHVEVDERSPAPERRRLPSSEHRQTGHDWWREGRGPEGRDPACRGRSEARGPVTNEQYGPWTRSASQAYRARPGLVQKARPTATLAGRIVTQCRARVFILLSYRRTRRAERVRLTA